MRLDSALEAVAPLLSVTASDVGWDIFLKVVALACVAVGSGLAFFGEAVLKRDPSAPRNLLSRITRLGWASLIVLAIGFITAVWSETDSIKNQEELLTRVDVVVRGTGVIIKQTAPTAIDAQLDSLVIRQTVEENPPKEPGDPTNKLVTFYVDVKKDSSVDKNKLLSRIKSVIYHLDPRWFSPRAVEVDNIAEDFKYSIGVWGSTPFVAEIVTSDPPRRLLRIGRINTVKTEIFE